MKFKMSNTKSEEDLVISEIRSKIAASLQKNGEFQEEWAVSSLQYCLSLIEDLKEENNSLWFMLDEMRSSRWTQEHTEELTKSITEHISMLKLMKMNKGEA